MPSEQSFIHQITTTAFTLLLIIYARIRTFFLAFLTKFFSPIGFFDIALFSLLVFSGLAVGLYWISRWFMNVWRSWNRLRIRRRSWWYNHMDMEVGKGEENEYGYDESYGRDHELGYENSTHGHDRVHLLDDLESGMYRRPEQYKSSRNSSSSIVASSKEALRYLQYRKEDDNAYLVMIPVFIDAEDIQELVEEEEDTQYTPNGSPSPPNPLLVL
ncbi:hypothetical protein K435DRAFT_845419 [Dendrothele bispora CBS 962.96]|uniref:Uncharacterized protein n=1 Tax=Dendrothele bispora (strain CBS 962.96) TaxID=1314807 RepID=A0A4S8KUT0_DENBC|nr:hypothetical protein K435DRAFT_845419 [Dendrothele bispora CBS 962.96]